MRSRVLPVAALGAAALITGVCVASQAGAAANPGLYHGLAPTHQSAAAKAPCYSNNGDESEYGVLSTATSDPAGDTSTGAVDFTVAKKCTIGMVTTTGVYGAGSGPAASVTVTFTKSKNGAPGKVVSTQNLTGNFASPDYAIAITPVKLKKGNYFAIVQANMDYAQVGGWYWELTTTQVGAVSEWENNGGGFGICPTWQPVTACQGVGNDFMLELSK